MGYDLVHRGDLVEIYKISDYFYFRRANLPIRRQCNGAFIVGAHEVAVVDAPPGGIEMIDEAEKLFQKPITSLYITHGHGDHAEGLDPFLDRDLTVYCSHRLLDTLIPAGRKRRAGFVGVHDRLDLRLSNDVAVELFVLDELSHSKGDMFIRVPQLELVCTGDCVVEYQTAYFHQADVHSWINSLKKLSEMKGKFILSGHNHELFPYSYLDDFAAYLKVVEKCSKICLERFHPLQEGQAPKDRFEDAGVAEGRALVEAFFEEKSADAVFLEEKAGKTDARRAVRMALWQFTRDWIR